MSVEENMRHLQESLEGFVPAMVAHLVETKSQGSLRAFEEVRVQHTVFGRELKITVLAKVHLSRDPWFELSHFSLSHLPGCREVLIFHRVTVSPEWRNRGVGEYLHGVRLQVARKYGARVAMCTVLAGNSIEKQILHRAGWRVLIGVSPNIEMWSREL